MGGKLRRFVQASCLVLFCLLLGMAKTGSFFGLPSDLFLRLDPLVGTAIPLVTRTVIPALFPAVFTILLAVLAGRIFCGWLCPMGATLDIFGGAVRRLLGRGKNGRRPVSAPVARSLKYLVLAVILTAALCGVNLAFWASPIPLTTRLYALVLHPLGLEGIGQGLEAVSPLLERLGAVDWLYWHPDTRYFYTSCVIGAFWFALSVLESVRPRFWCRYLCPAGALLGLFSRFAFWKRHVSTNCTSCGRCSAQCPMGILKENPALSQRSECLTCQACVSTCSHNAVSFGFGNSPSAFSFSHQPTLPSRRAFCASLAAGATLAGLSHVDALCPSTASGGLVRPPSSHPETDFLNRCLRCGECMKACPTGGLQPIWFQAGFSGMFTPFLDPRSGACRPDCAACGAVCPTQAIHALPLEEKKWAKTGTAVIDRKTCLAWAEDRRCMVCKENCPYGAVDVVEQKGHRAPVPVVHEKLCYGCGFCEKHCPKSPPAIVVEPVGALRLNDASFEKTAKAAGLELEPGQHQGRTAESNEGKLGIPPVFLE